MKIYLGLGLLLVRCPTRIKHLRKFFTLKTEGFVKFTPTLKEMPVLVVSFMFITFEVNSKQILLNRSIHPNRTSASDFIKLYIYK